MKELLEYITKKILPHPDDVVIEETIEEGGTVRLTLTTHPDDTGLAIGKGGKTAHAIRELLKIKAIQNGQRVYLDIKSSNEDAQPVPRGRAGDKAAVETSAGAVIQNVEIETPIATAPLSDSTSVPASTPVEQTPAPAITPIVEPEPPGL